MQLDDWRQGQAVRISEDTKDWIRVFAGIAAFVVFIAMIFIFGALICVGVEWIMELRP